VTTENDETSASTPRDLRHHPQETPRRFLVVGAGLIGGSIAAGLRQAGWSVAIADANPDRSALAVDAGIADELIEWPLPPGGSLDRFDVGVVAVPAGAVVESAAALLGAGVQVVTDVASTKSTIANRLKSPRFVAGHPMAGSEQHGLAGANGALFVGATWLLTPTEGTASAAVSTVQKMVRALGAEVMTVSPEDHDEMVAVVSHVPHLTAVTLMAIASSRADSHSQLLRLAAGGFRDMTRIAAGHPLIWPDICIENRTAIDRSLAELIGELQATRALIASGDRDALLERLRIAQEARVNLPTRATPLAERLAEVRVRLDDSPGQLAAITAEASKLATNIYDIEIAHFAEGPWGTAILVVDDERARAFSDRLNERGFVASTAPLEPSTVSPDAGLQG
jgi:prephenate dehydrogenase